MTTRRVRNIALLVLGLLLIISTSVLAAPYGSRSLYVGRFGGDVRQLQERLTSLGYEVGGEPGLFGEQTRRAVLQFQRDYGLVPDGIADKWTFRAVDRAHAWQHGSSYTVVPGDSLWTIATRHGTDIQTVVWLNRLQDSMIYPGQTLRLPGGGEDLPAPPEPPSAVADQQRPGSSGTGTQAGGPSWTAPLDGNGDASGPPPTGEGPGETGPSAPGSGSAEPDAQDPGPGTTEPEAPQGEGSEPEEEEPGADAPEPPTGTGDSLVSTIAGVWERLEPSGWARVVTEAGQPEPPASAPPPDTAPPAEASDHEPPAPPGKPPEAPSDEPAQPEPQDRSDLVVLGYYAEDWVGDRRSLRSLQSAAGLVDLIVNFQMQLQADGSVVTRDYPDLMAEARARGLPVQGLVHNYHGGWFDAGVARAVLSSPAVRSRAIANMVGVARQQGLSGINIDLENVPPSLRDSYTALIRELSGALHAEGLTLSISIPAKTWDDRTNSWSGAFDYRALGQYADYVAPMAYDEHTPGWEAGPVASIGWYEKVAAYAASQIPPEKVLLGVPAYGYDWKAGTTQARGLSVPQAMELAMAYGARIEWDERGQVPYFHYVRSGQERVVYYENGRSLAPKLDVVQKYNLGGIAIWRLGLEDPAIWSVIAQKQMQPSAP